MQNAGCRMTSESERETTVSRVRPRRSRGLCILHYSFRRPLNGVMTARQRHFAARAQIVDQPGDALRLLALMPGVVDHDDGGPVAGAKTFDFDQREGSGLVGLSRPDHP